jgi:hypothetical protein
MVIYLDVVRLLLWILRLLFYRSDIDVTLLDSDAHTALLKAPETEISCVNCLKEMRLISDEICIQGIAEHSMSSYACT